MTQYADKFVSWLRSQPFFLRLTLFTRILLAAGFIPTGLVKLLGRRFTTLPVDTPIGAFFESMYQTGLYWNFIGASQVLAGLLLLFPRFAHLGAALFVPIMLNIFVITVSLGFGGTPVVTGVMLLAVLYLCLWDYDRFRGMLTTRALAESDRPPRLELDPLERIGFDAFAISLFAFFMLTRSFGKPTLTLPILVVGLGAGLFTLFRFLTTGRRLRA